MVSGQLAELLDRSLQEFGIGRKVTFLACTVVSTVTRARSRLFKAPVAWATRRLSANRMSSRSPMRLRQWLNPERS